MSRKWSTRRKSLAIGLAVVGVAGLSLASASQINFDASSTTFQSGSVSVNADCQGAANVTVQYAAPTLSTTATNPWSVQNVSFGAIDPNCAGLTYDVAYTTTASTAGNLSGWVEATSGKVPAVVSPATTSSFSINAPSTAAGAVDVNTITGWALTIHS